MMPCLFFKCGLYTSKFLIPKTFQIHAIFATLVPGFSSPFPNMGLTALATQTHEPGDQRFIRNFD
jgi:hypothetical protein